jgi:RNA recognition motif-containing protein
LTQEGGPHDTTTKDTETSMVNRLYVGNLSFSTGSDALRDAFARFGEVTDVHLVTDRMTGQPRGFGFVTMGTDEAARSAIASMNGSNLDGRELRVNEAEERQGGRGGGFGGGGRGGFGGGGKRERW